MRNKSARSQANIFQDQPHVSMSGQYLTSELIRAINDQDRKAILGALEEQEVNEMTEAISNRLVAREFLITQKEKLTVLESRLSDFDELAHVVDAITAYLEQLKDDFDSTFVSPGKEGKYAKLSGDRLFREALHESGEEIESVASYLTNVNPGNFTSPKMIFGWMSQVKGSITESLWQEVQTARESGIDQDRIQEIRQIVAGLIADTKDSIEGTFPQA